MNSIRVNLLQLGNRARSTIGLLLFLLASNAGMAQSSLRCHTVPVHNGTFQVSDSLVYDPTSVELMPILPFVYEPETKIFRIISDQLPTEIQVCYRVMPFPVKANINHKSISLYDANAPFQPKTTINNYEYQKDELFSTPDIYKTGSLTRGVSFGNAQSLSVNSIFNFQMDGKLSDRLNIRADITDQNVPFQPEGNTLQVREFDNITFEVYNENLSLKAGDIVLTNGQSHFLRYYKNVQGGQFDVAYRINERMTGKSSIGVAAAKGQFADVTVLAVEGLQGPYSLPGGNGQPFVIVVANTEKVYLDGKLLTRGYNYDYVIDYNLGEVTFNPTIQITQFSRIRVTFEYVDQNYSRSIINANQSVTIGETTINFGFFQEKDNKNKPLAFSLSDEEKLQMSEAGDDDLPVPISGGNPSEYNSSLVLYEKIDTVDLVGNIHSIFKYTRDSTEELYRVSFTKTGSSDYILQDNDVNGRIYEWVSATADGAQGEYAAVRFVPAPNQRSMMTLGVTSQVTDHLSAYGEVALSDQDLNQFSTIGNDNNQGIAFKVGITASSLAVDWMPKSTWQAKLDYEHNGADFQPIDRYRDVEYDRNWGYKPAQDTFRTANNIVNATIGVQKDLNNMLSTRFSLRKKEGAIDGYQHEQIVKKKLGPFQLAGKHFYMKNQALTETTNWRKWLGEVYMDRFFLVPGYKISEERNEVALNVNDSLVRTVMNFTSHNIYLRNSDSSKVQYRLDYTVREDRKVYEGTLNPYSNANVASANVATNIGSTHQVDLTFTYREVQYLQLSDSLQDENSVLGRLKWQGGFFKNMIRTDLSYATSSSREILREYVFVEVAAGQGTHTWRDLNEDGIQDLTEFFIAINFDEKTFIKVFVPTQDFVNAYNTVLVFTVNSQFPRRWRQAGGITQFLSKFSNRTNLNINKKNTNADFGSRFNPFDLDISNDDLIYVRDAIRTVLFFNKSGRGFGGDIGYHINHSKQLISRGVEAKATQALSLNLRMHINRAVTLRIGMKNQDIENSSQYNEDRNYLISAIETSPGLIWQPKNNIRFEAKYRWSQKENILATDQKEQSDINAFELSSRWSNGTKNSLSAKVKVTQITYDGPTNTAAAYVLLESLQPGTNYGWSINYNQKLISGLQMSLGYEGRKSNDGRVIQMGRMQITALF